MPTYQYACKACDHRFERAQAFTDPSLTECPECAGALRKLYGSVGVVFKGSGFYRTDSRAGNGSGKEDKSDSDSSSSESSGSSSSSKSSDSGSSSSSSGSNGGSSSSTSSDKSAKSSSKAAS